MTSDREGDAPACPTPHPLTPSRLDVLRVVALLAAALSALLLIEDLLPEPRLCGFESECQFVLHSGPGNPLGVPLSAVGVLTFGTLFGLSLAPARVGRWLRPFSLLIGAAGALLIGMQVFALGHLCPYCLLVDALAVAAGCLAVGGRQAEVAAPLSAKARACWAATAALLTLAVSVGAVGLSAEGDGFSRGVAVPPRISEAWVPGKVTLVEVYDFECPHCRRLEPVLSAFLTEEGDQVHHVRLTVPMPAHRHARPASRAFLCAERQGRGDEMAKCLIVSPLLTPEACERIASEIGLSLWDYRSCVADPATDARLDADLAWVKEAHPAGLPAIWVQDQALTGLRPDRARETLRAAVRRAGARMGLPPL